MDHNRVTVIGQGKQTLGLSLEENKKNFSLTILHQSEQSLPFYCKDEKGRPIERFLETHPEVDTSWRELFTIMTKASKTKIIVIKNIPTKTIPAIYPQLCSLFEKIIGKFSEEMNTYFFPDDLISASILGIKHSLSILKDKEALKSLNVFRTFLLGIIQFAYKPTLTKDNLLQLEDSIQKYIKCIQTASFDTKTLGRSAEFDFYKYGLHEVLQLLLIMAKFTESSSISEAKYTFILSMFSGLFELLQKSGETKKLFCELCDYESSIKELSRGKLIFVPFGNVGLSLRYPTDKHKFAMNGYSLEYTILKFNYKVVKSTLQKKKLNYDKTSLNVFPTYFATKLLEAMNSLLELSSQPMKLEEMTLLLNEVYVVIKCYIVGALFFSEKVIKVNIQTYFSTIKGLAIHALQVGIISGLFYQAKETLTNLSIESPCDLISMIFNALLLFTEKRNMKMGKPGNKILPQVISLVTQMMSLINTIKRLEDKLIFEIYMLQFIRSLDTTGAMSEAYIEEIHEVLYSVRNDLTEPKTVVLLREKCFDSALSIYVKLAMTNKSKLIDEVMEYIILSTKNDNDLYNCLRIMLSLIINQEIPAEEFNKLMASSVCNLSVTISELKDSKELEILIKEAKFISLIQALKCTHETAAVNQLSLFIQSLALSPQIAQYLVLDYFTNYKEYSEFLISDFGCRFFADLLTRVIESACTSLGSRANVKILTSVFTNVLELLERCDSRLANASEGFLELVLLLETLLSTRQVLVDRKLGKLICNCRERKL